MQERVLKRATKMIPCFRFLSYQDRLAKLNMFSLRRMRLRGDMIEEYKMLNRLDRVEFDRLYVRDMSNTHGHSYKLFKNMFHTQIRQKFFTQRSIDFWNSLTQDVVSSGSLDIFKFRLDCLMTTRGFW